MSWRFKSTQNHGRTQAPKCDGSFNTSPWETCFVTRCVIVLELAVRLHMLVRTTVPLSVRMSRSRKKRHKSWTGALCSTVALPKGDQEDKCLHMVARTTWGARAFPTWDKQEKGLNMIMRITRQWKRNTRTGDYIEYHVRCNNKHKT